MPLTIFTPTYNRAYVIGELYESLKNQTNMQFQWMIVDDGSVDETECLVREWQKKCSLFKIIYIKQENGGKQRAHNKAVQECATELFFCVDSDDILVEDSVEIILSKWEEIKEEQYIAGMIALRGKDKKTPLGTFMPDKKQASLMELYQKDSFKGDTALIYRTDILKKYPFVLLNNEKFIGENYIYDQIDQNYKMMLVNKVIYICHYLDDGYTKSTVQLLLNNPYSYMLMKKQASKYSMTFQYKVRHMAGYIGMGLAIGEKHIISNSGNKLLAMISFPLGAAICQLRFKR